MKKEKGDTKKGLSKTSTMQTKKKYTHEQLNETLMAVEDLMERIGGCPFYPLHKTAECIGKQIDGKLDGDGIYVGVKKVEMTDQRKSMLRTLQDYYTNKFRLEDTDKGFKFELKEVPVYITVITRKYKYFDNPNITFYGVTEFLMPNPLDEYLKAQYLIK